MNVDVKIRKLTHPTHSAVVCRQIRRLTVTSRHLWSRYDRHFVAIIIIIVIIIIILAHQHKACRQLKIKQEMTAVGD